MPISKTKSKQVLTQAQKDQKNARSRQLYAEKKERNKHSKILMPAHAGLVLDTYIHILTTICVGDLYL